ncbi:MAG: hypothetical protein KKA44_00640 [Alphaproteobacteria bacterium]|nr:hypothetical protein [Alphaproteobacteria bacterium]MBU0865793.1 hypothetical protein [Alphaproteobacteria bacterium]MBU1823472.1 hypothetical protein [Alphaproteobacteria bacterium]
MALMVPLLLMGCSNSEYGSKLTRADVEQLATEMRVTIGDTPLVLPRIAVVNRDELEEARGTRAGFDRLEIFVRPFGWSDWEPELRKICPLLARRWVASVCDDPWAPVLQSLPYNRFYLVDRRAMSLFDRHFTAAGGSLGERLRGMRMEVGKTVTECDRDEPSGQDRCTAALLLSPHLVAVWPVTDGERERAQAMADREGKAIASFVRYAIAPDEDFGKLLPAMCELQRPEAKEGPNGDPCKL